MKQTAFAALLLMLALLIIQPEAHSTPEADTRLHKRSPQADSETSGGKDGAQDGGSDVFGIKKVLKTAHGKVVEALDKAHKLFVKAATVIHDQFAKVADRLQSWFAGKISSSSSETGNNGGGNDGSGGGSNNDNSNSNNEKL